jgi:hypothetical protein
MLSDKQCVDSDKIIDTKVDISAADCNNECALNTECLRMQYDIINHVATCKLIKGKCILEDHSGT